MRRRRLKTALDRNPRSIPLRERIREVATAHKHPEEAARHCLALVYTFSSAMVSEVCLRSCMVGRSSS